MNYNELIQLYFERSNALQGYWNLYVVVVGGLATAQRLATHEAITKFDPGAAGPTAKQVRDVLEPTLTPASHASVRTTHLTSDILVIAALWAMELRRRRSKGAPSTL